MNSFNTDEDTKKITRVSHQETKRKEASEEKTNKREKNVNSALLLTGGIVALVVLIISLVLLLLPSSTNTKEIEIPDVSGMSVTKAEKTLEKLGFVVKDAVTEIENI